MQTASKNLMDTLTEVYEPQWTGQDLLTVQGQNSEMLWADLAHKLSDQAWITQLPGLQTRDQCAIRAGATGAIAPAKF